MLVQGRGRPAFFFAHLCRSSLLEVEIRSGALVTPWRLLLRNHCRERLRFAEYLRQTIAIMPVPINDMAVGSGTGD